MFAQVAATTDSHFSLKVFRSLWKHMWEVAPESINQLSSSTSMACRQTIAGSPFSKVKSAPFSSEI
jgi:hypothetical protein